MAIADRLAVMRAGAIVQTGDPESLYRAPTHSFVAEFLGRVNRLVRCDADRRDGVVRLGGVAVPCPPALADQPELLLRPGDIRLEANEGSAGATDAATIVQRVFLGDRIQLNVQTADQGTLLVDASKDEHRRAGDRVRLAFDPERLMRASEAPSN